MELKQIYNGIRVFSILTLISCVTISAHAQLSCQDLLKSLHTNAVQKSQYENPHLDHELFIRVSAEDFTKSEIKINGEVFKAYETVSVNDASRMQSLKLSVFYVHIYKLVLKTLDVDLKRYYRISVSPDGSQVRLLAQEHQQKFSFGEREAKIEEKLLLNKEKWSALRTLLGDHDVSQARVDIEDGHMIANNFGVSISDPTMQTGLNPNQFLGSLDKSYIRGESLPEIQKLISELPIQQIKDALNALKLPRHVLDGIVKRQRQALGILDSVTSILNGNPDRVSSLAKKSYLEGRSQIRREDTEFIKKQIRARLDKDIAQNTAFKNFEEYKAYVSQFPEYQKIIRDFQENATLNMNRHRIRRASIIQNGFKTIFQTDTSSISNSQDYKDGRVRAESAGLGLSAENYIEKVPVSMRPKSTYLSHAETSIGGESRYGSDNYYMKLKNLMEDPDGPVVTFTLGDSLDESHRWYGKPVLAEDFAYLAAPFIHDARLRTGEKTFTSLDYRKGYRTIPEVLPQFLGGLENKMKIDIRNDVDAFEPIEPSSLYTEAQVYGYLGIGDVDQIAVKSSDYLSPQLLETYKKLGITIKRYK